MEHASKSVRHRFRRTVNGILHYADVTMALDSQHAPTGHVEVERRAVQNVYGAWLDAAIRGATRAANDCSVHNAKIEILLIQGTVIDTRDDVIEVAAYRCAFELLTGTDAPEPVLTDGVWRVGVSP